MKAVYFAALSSLIFLSSEANAGPTAATGKATTERRTDPDAVTCKTTTVVGSRIPVRLCRTNAEWEAEQRALVEERRSSRGSSGRCGERARC